MKDVLDKLVDRETFTGQLMTAKRIQPKEQNLNNIVDLSTSHKKQLCAFLGMTGWLLQSFRTKIYRKCSTAVLVT